MLEVIDWLEAQRCSIHMDRHGEGPHHDWTVIILGWPFGRSGVPREGELMTTSFQHEDLEQAVYGCLLKRMGFNGVEKVAETSTPV